MSLRCESEAFGPGRRRQLGLACPGASRRRLPGQLCPCSLAHQPLSGGDRVSVVQLVRRCLPSHGGGSGPESSGKMARLWEKALTTRPGASAGSAADRGTLRSFL